MGHDHSKDVRDDMETARVGCAGTPGLELGLCLPDDDDEDATG